ncbi:signal peptidase I [Arthrobacter cavernae]|uniref:signal peptidase I n=1 Tax=Arthrobacter cavernae TaxID=2817681 RepID=UPI001F6019BA|nr:signal peptidase I [Arthrobacter cavernae]
MPETTPGTPERHDDVRQREGTPATESPRRAARKAALAADRQAAERPGLEGPGDSAGARDEPGASGGAEGAAEDTGEGAGKNTKSGNPLLLWLKEIATVVVIAVVLSFLIKTFLFRAFYIPSESMVNTLDINDRIFINLLVPEPFALQRGDVVVFRDAQGWLPAAAQKPAGPFTWVQDGLEFVGLLPDDSEQHLVKRVVGLPGDRVSCCDASGRVSVNGVPLDESYVNPAEIPSPMSFDVVVPAGKVWVMGDNRNHSADSRLHQQVNGGFVNISDVEGKATVIAWPVNRWNVLDNHPDVFRNVPAGAAAGSDGK